MWALGFGPTFAASISGGVGVVHIYLCGTKRKDMAEAQNEGEAASHVS